MTNMQSRLSEQTQEILFNSVHFEAFSQFVFGHLTKAFF